MNILFSRHQANHVYTFNSLRYCFTCIRTLLPSVPTCTDPGSRFTIFSQVFFTLWCIATQNPPNEQRMTMFFTKWQANQQQGGGSAPTSIMTPEIGGYFATLSTQKTSAINSFFQGNGGAPLIWTDILFNPTGRDMCCKRVISTTKKSSRWNRSR